MNLEKVELCDVRQFVGKQSIVFATDPVRRVTLIHGPNTTGKTTLLNAVYWCFYGKFLEGFLEQERLRSEQAEGQGYFVEVHFEHRGRRYIARRASQSQPSSATLTVLQHYEDGRSVPHPQPGLLINSILPAPLAMFFFFAGEMIKKGFSTGSYQKNATDSIRAVLGLKLAEQALEDLKDIRKRRRKELTTLSEGTDLARVTAELTAVEASVDTLTAQLGPQRILITQLEGDKRKEFDRLRGMESSSKLQTRRDTNNRLLADANARLAAAKLAQQELIAEFGGALFLKSAAHQASSLISDAVTKKRIPSPFDKTFVKDILSSQVCICGQPVHVGSKEYQAIASLINTATDEHAIQNSLLVRGVAERVAASVAACPRAFTRVLQQLHQATGDVERLEQEEAMISELFRKHEEGNVRESEKQLDRIESTLRELVTNKLVTEAELVKKKDELIALRAEKTRAKAASPQIAEVNTAVNLLESLIASLEAELLAVENQGLQRINSALNDVVEKSTRQKYSAEVSRDYVISLWRSDASGERRQVFVLSSGEQRLLDLCFVASLVAVCREREEETNSVLLPGAVAPLMVDAPFGDLDPEYQKLAAETMMNLSDQLILMLSKTHWTEKVDEAIRPSIGSEYLMVGYRTGVAMKAENVTIKIGDNIYQQMVYDSKRDWTELKRVGEG